MQMIAWHPRRLASIEALVDPASLGSVIGPVVDIRTVPFAGVGYSSAALSHVHVALADGSARRFVLKRTRVDHDWTARRSNDAVGREALLLAAGDLSSVWEAFACPYVAFATEPPEAGCCSTI